MLLEESGEYVSQGIKSYSIDSDYMTATDGWEFVVYDDEDPAGLRSKFAPLQPVTLYVDGHPQVTGRIDAIETESADSSALRVSGRDYIADLVDGTADPSIRFSKGSTVADALTKVCAPYGIDTIIGDNNLNRNLLTGKVPFGEGPPIDFKAAKLSDFKVSDNTGCWQVISNIAARHGFTVQPIVGESNGARTALILSHPEYRQDPIGSLTRPGNVIAAMAKRDYSRVPTVTVARGHTSTARVKYSKGTVEISTFKGGGSLGVIALAVPSVRIEIDLERTVTTTKRATVATGELSTSPEISATVTGRVFEKRNDPKSPEPLDGKLYRPAFYSDKEARTIDELEHGVRKMVSERLRDTLTYEATVRGHRDPDTDAVYAVDTILEVADGIEGISERMWVKRRTFTNGPDGPKTKLQLIRPETYIL